MSYLNNNTNENNLLEISHKHDYITKNANPVVNTHPFTTSVSLNWRNYFWL